MAQAPLKLDIGYFPDPVTAKPIAGAKIYVGVADKDPEILANRIPVTLIQEDGTRVIIAPESQPIRTGSGGTLVYGGDSVVYTVDGVHSLRVRDSINAHKYYVPFANQSADVQANEGVRPVNGSFEFDSQVTGQPDNWSGVVGTNGTVELSTDSAHSLKSLKFTGTDATGGGVYTSDKFDVLAGGSIDIEFSYKSSSVDTLNKIDVNWYNSADALVSTSSVLNEGAANPLTYETSVVSITAPATAKRAEIVLTGVDGTGTTIIGSTYFDGVAVRLYTGIQLTSPVIESPVINTGVSGTAIDTTVTTSIIKVPHSNAVKTYADALSGVATKVLSGSFIDFTLPAGVTGFTVSFFNMSMSVTSDFYIRLGDSDGVESTGYSCSLGGTHSGITMYTDNTLFLLSVSSLASEIYQGLTSFGISEAAANRWSMSGSIGAEASKLFHFNGSKSLSGELTTVRIGCLSGVFDAGIGSIAWRK